MESQNEKIKIDLLRKIMEENKAQWSTTKENGRIINVPLSIGFFDWTINAYQREMKNKPDQLTRLELYEVIVSELSSSGVAYNEKMVAKQINAMKKEVEKTVERVNLKHLKGSVGIEKSAGNN